VLVKKYLDATAVAGQIHSYLLEIVNEQSSCVDPITGRRALLSDARCSLKELSAAETADPPTHDSSPMWGGGIADDHAVYRHRRRMLSDSRLMADDGAARSCDAASLLHDAASGLDGGGHALVLGARFSGKTTLLQQLNYLAANLARDEPTRHIPVLLDFADLVTACRSGAAAASADRAAANEDVSGVAAEGADRQDDKPVAPPAADAAARARSVRVAKIGGGSGTPGGVATEPLERVVSYMDCVDAARVD
jgi:pyruvate/2-oxoglutarate dehydrogenase complex dihydrolipoamide acyltransferase (E2) component